MFHGCEGRAGGKHPAAVDALSGLSRPDFGNVQKRRTFRCFFWRFLVTGAGDDVECAEPNGVANRRFKRGDARRHFVERL